MANKQHNNSNNRVPGARGGRTKTKSLAIRVDTLRGWSKGVPQH